MRQTNGLSAKGRLKPVPFAVCAFLVSTALYLCVGTLAARAAGPGLRVWTTAAPTSMLLGIDEVQEVTATESTFTLSYEQQTTATLNATASPGEVEAALDALSTVGAGSTHVEAVSSGVYRVTFVGALADMKTGELAGTGATTEVKTEGAASGTVVVDVINDGAVSTNGAITISDTLPSGFEAKQAGSLVRLSDEFGQGNYGIDPVFEPEVWNCHGKEVGEPVDGAKVVTCENNPVLLPRIQGGAGLPTVGEIARFQNPDPVLGITVAAESESERGENKVVVAGGGAPTAAAYTSTLVASSAPPAHGIAEADAWFSNEDGTTDFQAGSHPYAATFTYAPAIGMHSNREAYVVGGEARNLESRLPPGLVGDLSKMGKCTRQELQHELCPPESMVGVLNAQPMLSLQVGGPIFNMQPEQNSPAELGFVYGGITAFFTFSVRSGENYGVTAHLNNLPPAAVAAAMVTLWGVPADRSHNFWRSYEGGCSQEMIERPQFGHTLEGPALWCAERQGQLEKPILTMPTVCAGPQPVTLREVGAWGDPAAQSEVTTKTHEADGVESGLVGCEQMRFEPFTALDVGTQQADSGGDPLGEISTSLATIEDPTALSPETVKALTVTLPPGFALNPERATGLEYCSAAESEQTTAAEATLGEENNEPAACRPSSKLASVEVETPLLEAAPEPKLTGKLFLLESTPPEVKVLLAASADGVNIKLPGTVTLNQSTGAVTATFTGIPPFPFSHARLKFGGGYAGSLVTPARCGSYESLTTFETWGNPTAPTQRQELISVNSSPGGGKCSEGQLPFAPSFEAGASKDVAGASVRDTLAFHRNDGEQRLASFHIAMPLGVTGDLALVKKCEEPAAQQGTCDPASAIGHVRVAAGPGSQPFVLPQPGAPEAHIYLTGPYHGAPFGVSIVTPIVAGPFNLGTIVTRGRIEIDPVTAQVMVTTDPLPQIVDGVPTDVRWVEAVVDRQGFMLNPTSCEAQSFTAQATSAAPVGAISEPSATTRLSAPFAVSACRQLSFSPTVSLSVSGHASRQNGADVTVHVKYPKGALGQQSWLRSAKIVFPRKLSARLTTIQQSCDVKIFETARQKCPAHSVIGRAKVKTPILPVDLEGPVYFVSYANSRFPSAVMLLSGDGINIQITSETNIKAGITSATLRAIPDVPFEEATVSLPSGPYSEFAANLPTKTNYNFCGQKLPMPVALTGHNGRELHNTANITITNCKKKHASHAHKTRRKPKKKQ